jgi:molybdopterin molybdotransferase
MITVENAESCILGAMPLAQTEICPIVKSHGRILRENIYAERNYPPFHRVAMDGVAVNWKTITDSSFNQLDLKMEIEAIARAGSPQMTLKDSTAAIEVMTGAPLPHNTDCVIRYEDVFIEDNVLSFSADATFSHMQNVHQMSSDFCQGDLLLTAGKRIGSVDVGMFASQGKGTVKVGALPRIAIISTGDELVGPGESIEDHQIRKSNPYTLQAELGSFSFDQTELFHLSDQPEEIHQTLLKILENFDFLILTGGVSKGKFDYIPDCLEKLNVKKIFHKVTQRPGKPFWFGVKEFDMAQNKAVFALPGNPVSSAVCLRRYVIPALMKYCGRDTKENISQTMATLHEDVVFKKDLTYFHPVKFEGEKCLPVKGNGSGDYYSISKSDGFIELPRGKDSFLAGESFSLYLWGEEFS